ncbi:BamA/TamA family outer membrane protein [Dyadobacter aurulentus]|uniref:BamA/TamA family outer membrane protein n=1 Tax=Dyadobacter sp. UC 10 TaxID=2605428 RepID=UPI0011F2CDC1|nr:BamA/TamA family outer membrane protein [Dyadobacter sp. UC 10]KAA0989926.1 BamA/TamA family outer membrane protein [Dyadobacter sp. UC 10]
MYYRGLYFLFLFLTITGHTHSQTVASDSTDNVVIGEIKVEGNHKTRSSIILREIDIRSGDTLSIVLLKEKLEIDRRKVVNTNLFITVEMLTQPNADSVHTDVRIVVKERWYLIALPVFQLADRNFNEWWYERKRDLSRTTYGAYLSYGNVTGRADKLRFLAEFGFIPKFEIAYSLPYLDKAQKTGITIGSSYSINKTTAFRTWRDKLQYLNSEEVNRQRFYSYVSLTRRNKYYTFHSLDLRWSHTRISDTIAILNPNYMLDGKKKQQFLQLTYSFSYDKRDHVQYALQGQTFGFQVSKLGLLPTDDVNTLYVYGSFRKFVPLGKKFFFNTGFRGRLSFPKRQPYLQTIGLGYRNDLVRGYELYVVDGQDYALLKNEFKYRLFSIQKHFSFIPIRQFNTIPLALYINTFADAGYVKNSYPEFSNTKLGNSMLYGAGAGLDLVTFYNIVTRFNFTLNAQGEKRFFFNVSREF